MFIPGYGVLYIRLDGETTEETLLSMGIRNASYVLGIISNVYR